MVNYYRLGNFTPSNFTPRLQDTVGPGEGLSVATAAPAVARAQTIDSDLFHSVTAQNTPTPGNAGHYSVLPIPPGGQTQQQALDAWAATRANLTGANNVWGNANVSAYSTDLHGARTGQVN